ncbi:hypothetical protein LUW76_37485 [Actinomadura madurae]|uniref:hypothetical protein n=1 Tax=Actinomadura madurae TaxID=1993 RepID=UPI0020273E88|nr:hypothetical protein [Actinomadura madurae]URM99553.1 hypothetical protein LUW76_37485 [Actinomadura madurae]URN10219.1 hypothetical protein LUW74_47385 [Actinomadura madurae]
MRKRVLAILPLALALTLTGCGGDEGGSQVASAGGAKKGAAGGEQLSKEEMGLKFAQCMRDHGVDMEDPKPGEGVQLKVKGGPEKQEAMKKAMEACRQYSPQANRTGAPDPKAQQRAQEFAECMRENGVKDFPDPDPNEPGIRIQRKKGDDDATFEKAQQACQKILQGGKQK